MPTFLTKQISLEFIVVVKILSPYNKSFTFFISLHGRSIRDSTGTGEHCVSAILKDDKPGIVFITLLWS